MATLEEWCTLANERGRELIKMSEELAILERKLNAALDLLRKLGVHEAVVEGLRFP